jgi:hypothetical protein
MKNLLNRKDLTLFLFTKCNLNCDFCAERPVKSNDIDIEAIKNIPKLLEDNYPEELKNKELERIVIDLEGGELFSDDIPDNMFDIYEEVCNNVILLIRKYLPDIKIEVNWISNGVNTKPERILELFDNTEVLSKLLLSYDPIGRYKTKEQFEMFENTFWYFYNLNSVTKKIPVLISTVLTNKNIECIINNDKFIMNLPKEVSLDFCYYSGKLYQPSDDDLFNFYKWCIDNDMFQFGEMKKLMNSAYNKIGSKYFGCKQSYYYYKNKIYHSYDNSKSPYGRSIEANSDIKININRNIDLECNIGMNKRGCLICEYKDICYKSCWCDLLYGEFNKTECFIKRSFKYLDNHPEVKDRYLAATMDNCEEFRC